VLATQDSQYTGMHTALGAFSAVPGSHAYQCACRTHAEPYTVTRAAMPQAPSHAGAGHRLMLMLGLDQASGPSQGVPLQCSTAQGPAHAGPQAAARPCFSHLCIHHSHRPALRYTRSPLLTPCATATMLHVCSTTSTTVLASQQESESLPAQITSSTSPPLCEPSSMATHQLCPSGTTSHNCAHNPQKGQERTRRLQDIHLCLQK
jgi:hypothetical protein